MRVCPISVATLGIGGRTWSCDATRMLLQVELLLVKRSKCFRGLEFQDLLLVVE